MSNNSLVNKKLYYACFVLCILLLVLCSFIVSARNEKNSTLSVTAQVPKQWDSSYVEDYAAYNEIFNEQVHYASTADVVSTVEMFVSKSSVAYRYDANPTHMTAEDRNIAQLDENAAWDFISNGLWKSYPKGSYASHQSELKELRNTNTETITVYVWYWAHPNDETDLTKTTTTLTIAVNSKLADTFRHIFEDIYDDPSQPVINLADKGMGTWVLRGKNHNSSNEMSAHALGCAIDINPSTGSVKIGNYWYGNGYGQRILSYDVWKGLDETHTKYNILYAGCPIVEIFKSYGFYWGGDWSLTKDPMHLSYIGDGSDARAIAIGNYLERN